jgi:DNA adenine methylase
MQYMGGKTRIAKQIAAVIDQHRKPGQLVWDAFCGGLSVSVALSKNGPVLASDACAPLINLYKAVQAGWDPPTEVSKETYLAAKNLPDTDPMKAFCGFGCSFGGKWFGGYASPRKNGRSNILYSRAVSARKSLIHNVPLLNIEHRDFFHFIPAPTESILYLDPPFKDTTKYNAMPNFDHDRLIDFIQGWSQYTDIFVSEYELSIGKEILSKSPSGSSCLAKQYEKLFHIPKRNSP